MKSKAKKGGKPPVAPALEETLPETDLLRHTFLLKFYGTGDQMSGQMESLNSREKIYFSGIDTGAIMDLLHHELNAAPPSPAQQPVVASPVEPLPAQGQLSINHTYWQGQSNEVLMRYVSPVSIAAQRIEGCTLWLRHIENGRTRVFSQVATRQLSAQEMEISLQDPALDSGLWQVQSMILLSDATAQPELQAPPKRLAGTSWLQVY